MLSHYLYALFILSCCSPLLGQSGSDEPDAPKPEKAAAESIRVSRATSPGGMDDAPRSIQQNLQLARWCRDRGHLAEMRDRLQRVLAADPDHAEARSMLAAAAPRLTAAEAAALKREVELQFRRLVAPSKKTRNAALSRLGALATLHAAPEIERHATELHRAVERLRSPNRRVVLEYRGTTSKLGGLRSRPVSLGIGTPAQIQLPELKTVRVQTTVGTPGS